MGSVVLNTRQCKVVLFITFSGGMPCLILHSTSDGLSVSFMRFCCQEAISNITPRDHLSQLCSVTSRYGAHLKSANLTYTSISTCRSVSVGSLSCLVSVTLQRGFPRVAVLDFRTEVVSQSFPTPVLSQTLL